MKRMGERVMKKTATLLILIMIVQLFFGVPTAVAAETIVDTYDLGPAGSETAVTGTLYSNGDLVIAGTGPMHDYGEWDLWSNKKSSIKKIVIAEGITTIGEYVFQNCTALESITIANSVTIIGKYAFRGCNSLTSVEIPNSVNTING